MAITFDVNLPGMPWKASISADGIYLSVAHYYSPYITIYKRNGEAFTKLADPASLPPAGGEACYDCSMSADGVYLAVAHYGSPRISIYKRSGDTFAKLADPTGGLPSDIGWGCALSPDATYLAVRHAGSPYLSLYKRTGDAFSRITDPTPAIGAYAEGSNGVCFSSDAAYLVVSKSTAPFFKIYKRAGDIFTGIADPTALPHARVYRCLFSPDDVHLVVATYSITGPYFIVYKRSGDIFTKLPNPIQPDFTKETLEPHIRGLAFSGDGTYLGIAFLGTPNAFIYVRNGDDFIKQAVPAGLPSLPHRGMTVAFFDDSRRAVLGTATSVPPVSHPNFTGAMSGFAFADALPNVPVPLAPINSYLSLSSEIVFSWQHNIDSGTAQKQADLQYKITGGEWTALTTITGSAQSVVIAANTFSSGAVQWRVRTYNDDSVASEWSAAVSFMAVGIPATPSILSVSNAARPTVAWSSWDQAGYQLQIVQEGTVIWDSGQTAGVVKSRWVPVYLANGNYSVRLRTINPAQFWSAWAAVEFLIDVVAPEAPAITAEAIADGCRVAIGAAAAGIVGAYLLRDGVPIADVTGLTSYDDFAALGNTAYVVRVVDEADNFADSNTAVMFVGVACAVLAPVDDYSHIIRLNMKPMGQPAVSRQRKLIAASQHYAGRPFPVHTFSEFEEQQFSLSYYYTSVADFNRLDDLISRKRTLLYRDVLGNRAHGVITSISHTQENDMIIFAMNLSRADHVEGIEYAAPWVAPEAEPEVPGGEEEMQGGGVKMMRGGVVLEDMAGGKEADTNEKPISGLGLGWKK